MTTDTYTVHPLPYGALHARVHVPGSKSITNRALCLAAFARGASILDNVLLSDDAQACFDAIPALGIPFTLDADVRRVAITGCAGALPRAEASINVRLAGTAARFLTAMLATAHGDITIDAFEQMRRRPMGPLMSALTKLGASFDYLGEDGHLPALLRARGLAGGPVEVDSTASSQFVSALLMCGPYCRMPLEVVIADGKQTRPSYVDITIAVMRDFGVEIANDDYRRFTVPVEHGYTGTSYAIEPDYSAAGYFLAMPLVTGGEIFIEHLSSNTVQGDARLLEVLWDCGAEITPEAGGLRVRAPHGGGYAGRELDMHTFSDQALTVAALAVYAESPTTIRNIAHVRHQECDRIHACVTEMEKLGIHCEEYDDGMTIYPGTPRPGVVDTYGDHRMAMAFALLGLRTPGIVIAEPRVSAKTFPEYFALLDTLTRA